MTAEEIIDCIGQAGSWLPLIAVRRAFTNRDTLASLLLAAVEQRATAPCDRDIRNVRLATFGMFFLAQIRDPRLFEPLVRLFEKPNPDAEDEWLFSGRLFFFGHRLLAGVCPHDPRRLLELALNANLKPLTRSLGVCAIGLLGAYGDITRAEAIRLVRETFKPMRALKEEWTSSSWARVAAKLHCRQFERELQWFLASGLLSLDCRQDIARALCGDPDAHLISVLSLEPMVDLFTNVFAWDIRNGEIGLLPNGQIPGLDLFRGEEPRTGDN
jgi:hypothetical protein